MANEDLNVWMYVVQFGTSRHKKEVFWERGFKENLWRKNKTISSLRNRYRFYVKHLTKDDILKIIQHVKKGKTHYINFA